MWRFFALQNPGVRWKSHRIRIDPRGTHHAHLKSGHGARGWISVDANTNCTSSWPGGGAFGSVDVQVGRQSKGISAS